MWIGKRGAQDYLNDYWNALDRHAPPDELARLRARIDPELVATIDTTRAGFRCLRPDPAFGERLEGDLMNAFALTAGGTAPLAPPRPRPTNGHHEPRTPAGWIPDGFDRRVNRRMLAVQLGLVTLLLLTLIGGFFAFSSRTDHPAVAPPVASPVSTPTEDWTNTRGDAGRTGLGQSGPAGQPVTIWKFHAAGPCDTAPAAVGDTVFAACGNGILYAINRATGNEQWQFPAKSPVVGGPTVLDGIVVLVDVDGRLYGVDAATGAQLWVDEGTFYGAPVAKDGVIAVGGFDGQLAAIDLATGVERWRYMVEEGGEAKNPAIGDGIVYSGSLANGFSAVDLQTGELVWHADTNGIETGTAVVANGVAYIGSSPGVPDGFLNAYNAATGDLLWSSDAPIFSPAVQDGTGYAGSADGPVTAIDLATGNILWQVTVGGVARPAVVAGDVVYMNSDGDEAIYAFDTVTGDQLWKYPVDGYLGDAPALKDGVLYTSTGGGSIYAIGGEHAIPAAGAATPIADASVVALPIATSPVASPLSSPMALADPTLLWTTEGGGDGFYKPGNITIAPDGNLWIADNGNSQFQILSPDGAFLENWGEQGSGDGQLELRVGPENDGYGTVAFAPDGSFFVLDGGNFRVQHFAADRSFIAAWGGFGSDPGTFQWPMDLAVDTDGTVWVIDGVRRDVQHFDSSGTLLGSFDVVDADGNPRETAGMAIGPDGLIYVLTQNKSLADGDILVYEPDGTFVRTIGDGVFERQSVRIAFDAEGRIYATEFDDQGPNGRLHIFEPDGTLIRSIDIGGFPYGVAVEADGSVIVSQYLNGSVSAYSIAVE